ncbi:phenylalanyl-tRNA synthetase beta subunit [Alkalibacterium subtropicum]|uniref:Phenylalanine--tRNA ligase beta subunit n=1 Tax=Alkalibacterium subtropicum TaxID=753702 RepID=A0A1I1GUC3_9LACT|nr:phenylalanine--tRNA ligase subunit beta [Alkalibacterium subtropicum]SFC14912.1 phenylalanyl-tRNA synthetase beta subunit [Alkalibacterium subtropicum]
MRVSVKWLSEYLDLSDIAPVELADQITLTGIEVDDVTLPSLTLDNLVVGEVLTAEEMADSDHLKVTAVDVDQEAPQQIVCGAPNVKAGQKVIVALPGAKLPNGLKIKKSKLRGVESNGMICSLQELGFAEAVVPKKAEDGIYVLPMEAKTGHSVLPYIGLDDAFIELDITPNRADALSMRGVGYEVGAILSQKPAFPEVTVSEDRSENISDYIHVSVDNSQDVPVYKMRVIKDVTVQESPMWLQRKLMNAGIRPIDAVVDVTNYIMLEYGQPLHAFDYDALESKTIRVRRAEQDEKLVTLDGQERRLNPGNLVITNGEKPVALAGVMGGENTHVTGATQTIALESALFESSVIRKTAQSLNLRSESSARFERGLNTAAIERALDHAAQLIADLGNGQVVSGVARVEAIQPESKQVTIALERINQALGTDLVMDEVVHLMDRLGFDSETSTRELTVTVPPRRWDIEIEADIIEEVVRLHGYNRLPATLPKSESIPGELTHKQQRVRDTRHFMEGAGLSQAISYALTTNEKAAAFSRVEGEPVKLDWPMSEEHQALRKSLLSGLLDNVQYNVARQNKHVGFYEIGRVFYPVTDSKLPREVTHVAGALTGSRVEANWQEDEQPVDFYAVKGILEEWFTVIGVSDEISYVPTNTYPELHPGRTAKVRWQGQVVGVLGQLHPQLADERDLKETYLFEIDMDALLDTDKEPLIYSSIPKYPGTSRDVAFVVDETVLHETVLSVMKENGGKWLKSIRLFDLYQGENIEQGKKSMAYSLSYQNPEATLKEEEVTSDFEQIKKALVEELNAEIR